MNDELDDCNFSIISDEKDISEILPKFLIENLTNDIEADEDNETHFNNFKINQSNVIKTKPKFDSSQIIYSSKPQTQFINYKLKSQSHDQLDHFLNLECHNSQLSVYNNVNSTFHSFQNEANFPNFQQNFKINQDLQKQTNYPNYSPIKKQNLVYSKFNSQQNLHSPQKSNETIFQNLADQINNNQTLYSKKNEIQPNFSFLSPIKSQNSRFISEKSLFHEMDEINSHEICLRDLISNHKENLYKYVLTRKGSKILQENIKKISKDEFDYMINLLLPFMDIIMKDSYGNYFYQSLIKICPQNLIKNIILSIKPDLISIALHSSGTHSLQSLIQRIQTSEESNIIIEELKSDLIKICLDTNGIHVIQKILNVIPENNRIELTNSIVNNTQRLINNQLGSTILKIVISTSSNREIKKKLTFFVNENIFENIQDPFASYVVQGVIEFWGIDKQFIYSATKNLIPFSIKKYSSSVIIKCLDFIDIPTKKRWVNELLNPKNFGVLFRNKYGKLILSKIFQLLDKNEQFEIRSKINVCFQILNENEKMAFNEIINTPNKNMF